MAPAALSNSTFFVSTKHQNNQLLPHSVAHKPNIPSFHSLESRASPAVMTPFKNFQPRSPALNISQTFTKLRQQSKVALIPYITAGDPDLSTTAEALKLLDACGSDVIELGVPNSDPILDGPVIQAACSRALANGTTFESVLSMIKTVAPQISCPITLFTYHNVIRQRGTRNFMADLNYAGVHGLVVPDAPLAESEILRKEASKNEIEMQLLTTPITPTEQMKTIAEAAEGFLYLVSSVGVTGARASVNPRVESLLREIKKETRKPVAVGFGISRPEHVKQVTITVHTGDLFQSKNRSPTLNFVPLLQVAGWGADGVIVGSAIVKLLGVAKSPKEGLKEIERFTKSLKSALP